jgi:hypothetical protein
MSLEVLERDLQVFARPKLNGGDVPTFEHLILFDEKTLSLGLKKGVFSPQDDLDLAWVMRYARGEETADLEGMDVFKFLAELAPGGDSCSFRGGSSSRARQMYSDVNGPGSPTA